MRAKLRLRRGARGAGGLLLSKCMLHSSLPQELSNQRQVVSRPSCVQQAEQLDRMEVATPAAKRKADSLQDTYATLGESGRESTAEEHAAGEHARSITRQGVRVRLRAGQLSRAPAAQAAQRRTTSSTPSPRTLSCRPRTRVRNAFPPANAGTDITGRTE